MQLVNSKLAKTLKMGECERSQTVANYKTKMFQIQFSQKMKCM